MATKPAWPAVKLSSGEPTVGLPAVELPLNSEGTGGERQFCSSKRKCDVGDCPSHADGRKDGAAGGGGGMLQSCSRKQELAVGARTPHVGGRKEERPPAVDSLTFGGWQVQLADLDVSRRYKIPKKQKPLTS